MPKTRSPHARRCNPSKAPKFARYGWTMASIKGRNTAAGQYFFSRDTRRFFGPEKFSGPYEGPGGVYFVKHHSRTGTTIYRFDPETGSIDFERFAAEGEALADVREAAKALARGARDNPSLAELRAGASRAYHATAPHVRRAASATAAGARRAYHYAKPKVKAGTRRALMAVSDYSARGARALDEGAHRCNPARSTSGKVSLGGVQFWWRMKRGMVDLEPVSMLQQQRLGRIQGTTRDGERARKIRTRVFNEAGARWPDLPINLVDAFGTTL